MMSLEVELCLMIKTKVMINIIIDINMDNEKASV